MSKIGNVDEMHQILGEPDAVHHWAIDPQFSELYSINKWKTQYTYDRWESLTLRIFQNDDDSVRYSWSGKEKTHAQKNA
ncbi:hypothetical protein L0244_16750 [bacterium]|nr:hypothetical protein [bacterium]